MGKRSLLGYVVLVASMAFAACGSEVSGPGGAGGSGSGAGGSGHSTGGMAWASYCDQHASLCGGLADKCKADESCARALLRDAIEPPLLACLAKSCDEDACLAQVTQQLPPTAIGQAFETSCQALAAKCPGIDDVCLAGRLLADDVLDAYQACAEATTCAAAEACFDQVSAATVDACDDWL